MAVYDAWNRLVGLSASGTAVGRYGYDGRNRRTSKVVSGSTTRHFYYSAAWQVLEERLGASALADQHFVCGVRYIDELVIRDRGAERLYVCHDPHFNVTAIVDSSGSIQERYIYSAYGRAAIMDGSFVKQASSQFSWDRRFAAVPCDLESDLIYSRTRYLNDVLGFWLQRDRITYLGGDMNLTAYALGNPIRYRDPFGQECDPAPEKPKRPLENEPCKSGCAEARKQQLNKFTDKGGKDTFARGQVISRPARILRSLGSLGRELRPGR